MCIRDSVHTDGGKCLDAMVYLRSTDRVAASATDADYSYPVSYTHLDVYKRQEEHQSEVS